MILRAALLSSVSVFFLGQIIDSSSAFAWVSNVGGLGIAAILALRTLPDAHREFFSAIERNTEALHAVCLTMRRRRRRSRISRPFSPSTMAAPPHATQPDV